MLNLLTREDIVRIIYSEIPSIINERVIKGITKRLNRMDEDMFLEYINEESNIPFKIESMINRRYVIKHS